MSAVVAVFDIHMDKNAVATINPKIIRDGLVPNIERIFKDIRWSNPHLRIDAAMTNPPRNRKIR
jgi:hypothetical protein